MKRGIHAIAFPFDLFGNAGTGAGASLLADILREIIEDTEQETRPTRADAYRGRIEISEFAFETLSQISSWRETGTKAVRKCIKDHAFSLWLSGNHLGVLPVYETLGPGDLIIQFDAHLDLFNLHDTSDELSHGNFLRHAESLPKLVNLGHRNLLIAEKEIAKYYTETISAAELHANPVLAVKRLDPLIASAKRVWIDLDCDAIDPAFCPAVHQRTPFGLAPLALLNIVESIWSDKIIGASISEFDPGRDVNEASLNLLGWWVEWLCLKASER
ncbi:MAG: arginase family protein [Gemmataceae bacterium]